MSAGGQLAGLELSELDRLLRAGAEPGPRPRRQPRDDQGVQRLARRRVVRRVPRPVHPVRHPAAVRRRRGGEAKCTGSRPRAVTRSRSRRTRPGSACRASTPTRGIRCSRPAPTTRTVLCCHVGSSSKSASTSADAPAAGSDEPVVGDGDLHARRPALGVVLAPLPRAALLAHRRRHRVDPVFPVAGRAHARSPQRLDAVTIAPQGLSPTELFRERILCCFIADRVGVKLLDEFNVDNVCWESDYPHSDSSWPKRPSGCAELFAATEPADGWRRSPIENAMRHFQFDPFARRPRPSARQPRSAPKPRTSTS